MQLRWRTPQMEASLAVRENTPHGRDQSIEFYRLAVELVAPRRERLFTLASERMCGESNKGDVAGLWIALQSPRGFPALDDWHFEGHQDDFGFLGSRHPPPFLAILRRKHP